MKTKIIEATNGPANWGRFLLGVLTEEEWARLPAAPGCDFGRPVLREAGWGKHDPDVLVLDLVTREGAVFYVNKQGVPSSDLNKHRVWVCPLFEPFLGWLYTQPREQVMALALPDHVDLADAPFDSHGYRRPGL